MMKETKLFNMILTHIEEIHLSCDSSWTKNTKSKRWYYNTLQKCPKYIIKHFAYIDQTCINYIYECDFYIVS